MVGFLAIPLQTLALTRPQRSEIEKRFWYDKTDCGSTDTPAATGGDVDRFLQVIAFNESSGSGDYIAQASGSTASGRYQYIIPTWNGVKQFYPPAIPYAEAKDAPGPMQDAVAKIEYEKKFRDLGNNIFNLALSHFWPRALTHPEDLDKIIGSNSITPRQYAQSVVDDIAAGAGQDIVLRYNEAPEFAQALAAAGITLGSTTPTQTPSTTTDDSTEPCTTDNAGLNNNVVDVAKAELAAWNAGAQDPSKFGGGGQPWCAYFISYIFNKAGQPLDKGGGDGVIGSAQGILDYARQNNFYHPKGEPGFKPQPGDVAIYKEGLSPYPSHVNLVISFDGVSTYTAIGGNESDSVKQSTHNVNAPYLTGFMRVQ